MLIDAGIEIMWPHPAVDIPAGWSRVAGMDGRHPKGAAAGVEADVAGGASTHSHTDPGHGHSIGSHQHTSTGVGATTVIDGHSVATQPSAQHGHSTSTSGLSSGTSSTAVQGWPSATNDPALANVIWIVSDGTPTGFPDGAWLFWDNPAATPTNWSLPAGGQGYFPKGVATGADGGGNAAGGAHGHTPAAHTHAFDNHAHSGGTTGSTLPGGGFFSSQGGSPDAEWDNSGAGGHAHSYSFAIGASASGSVTGASPGTVTLEPPHAKLAIIQNNTGGPDAAVRHVACWGGLLSAIPSNWALCDGTNDTVDMRGKFAKGAGALGEIGDTGGVLGHSHSDPASHTHNYSHFHLVVSGNVSSGSMIQVNTGNVFGNPSPPMVVNHTHAVTSSGLATGTSGSGTETAPTNSDTQPPFRTRQFIVLLSTLDVAIVDPTPDELITDPAMPVQWTITGGTGIQNDYRLIIYESDQTTVRYDSGQINSAAQSVVLPFSANLANNSAYYAQVTVHDTSVPGQVGTSAKVRFTTQWDPPAAVTGLRASAETEEVW